MINHLNIDSEKNNTKLAIVVVGYNRLSSIKRLLGSLENAYYTLQDIPLVISIDCSGDEELYKYVQNYLWPFGDKYVIIHEKRLGLKHHIFSCGDLTRFFKGIILLEDDIYVSRYFYTYALDASNYYDTEDQVACIALYNKVINENVYIPFVPYRDAADVYATQIAITWGQCWTKKMWAGFSDWLKENSSNIDFNLFDIPDKVKNYTKAWSKYFYAYLSEKNKFVISPYESFTTNFTDVGEHNLLNNPIAQVPISNYYLEYNFLPVEKLVKYDSFMNPIGLGKYLNVDDRNLCVDLSGSRKGVSTKRFMLSVNLLPYKCVREFALALRPIEANVIHNIQGKGIYLYDTSIQNKAKKEEYYPINFLLYYIGLYSQNILFKTSIFYITMKVRKIFKFFLL